jgi:hypothetical protein
MFYGLMLRAIHPTCGIPFLVHSGRCVGAVLTWCLLLLLPATAGYRILSWLQPADDVWHVLSHHMVWRPGDLLWEGYL